MASISTCRNDDGLVMPDYREPGADWQTPAFDPARPEGFADFLGHHRVWMLTMLQRELGQAMKLAQPRRISFPEAW